MAGVPESDLAFSDIFSQKNSRLPDDTVFYAIFPDLTLNSNPTPTSEPSLSSSLQSLHLQILQTLSPFTTDYLWQHESFTLSLSSLPKPSCLCSSHLPHLHGKLRFGDNLDDEWFTVFLLFKISTTFPSLSIRVWDTDGEFLLIEAAFHLPRWLNPENSLNRVFIRQGHIHIVPKDCLSSPNLSDSLRFIINHNEESRASELIQSAVKKRILDYPERAQRNMHQVRVRVPVSVAQVLKHEPCLISLAVEGFYDRDIDSMKYAAKMEKFLPKGREEELVCVAVKMSRAMYAQLVQQAFQAPKNYPMPNRSDKVAYGEAELGLKITCGLEMMYQLRKREGLEGKGRTWEAYKESLERSGYFQGLLPGSKEYQRLMHNAEEYYRNSSLFLRTSEMLSAPVKRIDEILALPHSPDEFSGQEVPPSDDDSWLYNGEDELNSALLERQKEMDLYNSKHKKKQNGQDDTGPSSSSNVDEVGLGDIAKTMQDFVHKVSSYKGAEVPENRNLKEVDLDVDRFIKDMESVMKRQGFEDVGSNVDIEDGSSLDFDLDESEDESDIAEPSEDNEEEKDTFMHSYSDAMNEELKPTSIAKSFVRANEQATKKDEGTSNATEDMDEDFTPVDVDVNLVKSFLDSFSSQQGLPGPASNLLGLMGVQLPHDDKKKGK
ncbi:protein ecdysoneless homolog [Quercus lobata]|uniref:Protein ecdysoneless homolog n=1 Tax=Quercus lobata TaxID=97700 RepID=A0A7N2LXJ9_QUELO|nr:protein ecdysoneless homolog [Quercus lobata]XP_030975297.1 protein ecdysoneless homolog [Quercus lobata]XP_030975298.1 protein ecdysoneless homolog [Quercus lobata]XP_030975299.1 protein ecdysoneless homolog [Quercus lobata]XP_030975300.1 protein ecdysoneless homolog [Quercus lobata]